MYSPCPKPLFALAAAAATLIAIPGSLPAQNVIATIAGSPKTLPAGSIQPLSTPIVPVAVTVAPNSDVYFIEQASHSVLKLTRGGDMTVVAGTGIEGYSGDGGPATSAALAYPAGLAIDSAGRLHIADSGNHRIRRINIDGTIQTVAGTGTQGYSGDGGQALSARIQFPAGLVFDGAGNLFIADRGNFVIRKMETTGRITTYAGSGSRTSSGDGGPAVYAGFGFPEFVAIDAAGNLYISDSAAYRVRKVSTAGIITTIAGTGDFGYSGDGGPGRSAAITIPQGISSDAAGNVYFADWLSQRVRRINPAGVIDTVAGNGVPYFAGDGGPATAAGLSAPVGVALDPAGGFVIADSENARVRRVNQAGVIGTAAGSGQAATPNDGGLATDAGLSLPQGIAVSSAGIIYVADRGNHRVRQITRDGKISTIAGNGDTGFSGDGGLGSTAKLGYPAGLAVDAAGALYIADRSNHRVRKVDGRGVITTFAGNGSGGYSGDGTLATNASLLFPTGVGVDSTGRVLIADSGNNVVRRVELNGNITTVAGNGSGGFSGDGGQALRAQFSNPSGVAVDISGNIYVTDTNNRRIRKITPSGVISTFAGSGVDGPSLDNIPAVQASLISPIGITTDLAGNVYFADRQDIKIRKVNPSGVITTVAGTGFSGFLGDGGLATQARLHFPEGVAVDGAGNVYFTDRDNNRVRVVLANPPTFTATPGALSFTATAQGSMSPAQPVTIVPIAGSQTLNAVGLPIQASTRDSWLKIESDPQGKLPVSLRLSVDPSGLSAGQYQTTVQLSSPATPTTRSIPVTVNVAPEVKPDLSLNTREIAESVTQGSLPLSKEVVISNTGSGTLSYTVTVTGNTPDWLSLDSAQGSATPSAAGKVIVNLDPKGLAPGTYSTVLNVRPSGGLAAQDVAVNLSVTAAETLIVISQSGLNFTAAAGGGAPLPQVLYLLNSGRGNMRWTAEVQTLSGGNWLSMSSTNGTLPPASQSSAGLDVVVNTASLSQGQYYGQILFRSPDAQNSPQTVSVVVSVAAAGTKLPPEIRPSGLIFSGSRAKPPGAQNVYIANLGTSPFSYASGSYTVDGEPWLAHLPINDSVAPNKPARLTVQADYRALNPGIYKGVITFQNVDDGTVRTLNVVSVVAPDEDAGPTANRLAGGCAPDRMKLVLTGTQQSISAAVGQAVPLEVQIVDSCSAPVTPATPGASVAVALSNKDQGGALVHTSNGRWSRTYQPRAGVTGRVTATITGFAIGAGGKVIGDQVDVAIDIANRTPAPVVGSGGVLNAASFESNRPVAPGSLVTFKGDQLAVTGPGQVGSGVPLPDKLNGTEVRLAGRSLPLLYAEAGQINAQLPFDLPPNTQHHLVVYRSDAVLSVPEAITIAPAKPAVFTVNQSGSGQGTIVNGVTNVVADAGHPVKEGDVITIYCTGLGAVSPTVPEGAPPPASPLSNTVNPVTVTVGGAPAQVLYSGLTPGITGLYQVNAVVPSRIEHGDNVVVTITSANQTSAPVTIAVR